MSGEWTPSDLTNSPHRIRPETHWFQETTQKFEDSAQKGRTDGRMWFSLRLTLDRANELRDAFAGQMHDVDGKPNAFAALVGATFEEDGRQKKAAAMAPASHAALCFAIEAAEAGLTPGAEAKLGTDIIVHPTA